MYARGMSTREIRGHVRELYGIEVSPELVSKVTDAVHDELAAWQSRPLESVYAIVYFDAVRVKIRDEGLVREQGGPLGHRLHLRRLQADPGDVGRADRKGRSSG